jgi:AcrR family transcriptional regulator
MNESKAIRGRPRAFDTDQALDAALDLFWRKGYEGTSIADLTDAMGINPPSLYAAFGGKEALFRQALDRYEAKHAYFWNAALAAPTAYEAIKTLLEGTAEALSEKKSPRGCLIVQGALSGGDECDPVRQELAARRNKSVTMIRERLARAKREGDLPKDADPASLARYFATVIHGMAVQAVSGVSRPELRRVASTALKAWPN